MAALSMENVGTNHNDAAIIEACVGPRDSLMLHSMYSRVGALWGRCRAFRSPLACRRRNSEEASCYSDLVITVRNTVALLSRSPS